MKISRLFFPILPLSCLFLLSCKTGTNEPPTTLTELSKNALVCEKQFTQKKSTSIEKYRYENQHLVKVERFSPDGNPVFVDRIEWKEGLRLRETRNVAGKDIFVVEYTYKQGVLDKKKVDDTDAEGGLQPDGSFDLEESFFYEPSQQGPPHLVKKRIHRAGRPDLEVHINYNKAGLETERITMQGEKRFERRTKTYTADKLSREEVYFFENRKALTYDYHYNKDNQIQSVHRKSDKGEGGEWLYLYDCPEK